MCNGLGLMLLLLLASFCRWWWWRIITITNDRTSFLLATSRSLTKWGWQIGQYESERLAGYSAILVGVRFEPLYPKSLANGICNLICDDIRIVKCRHESRLIKVWKIEWRLSIIEFVWLFCDVDQMNIKLLNEPGSACAIWGIWNVGSLKLFPLNDIMK